MELLTMMHIGQHLLFLKTLDLILRQRILHPSNSILHPSQLVYLFSNHVSMLIEIFLGINS